MNLHCVFQAVSFISNKLSSGQYDDLEGIVDNNALQELKRSLADFSVFQKELLRVAADDVFFLFPYQIGIIIPDQPNDFGMRSFEPLMKLLTAINIYFILYNAILFSDNDHYIEGDERKKPPQVRHVEITVVCHVLRGLDEMRKTNQTGSNMNFQSFIEDETTKYNVMVCNYRFFRDFTEGTKDPSWIVNMVNQYLPADYSR